MPKQNTCNPLQPAGWDEHLLRSREADKGGGGQFGTSLQAQLLAYTALKLEAHQLVHLLRELQW